MDAHLRRLVRDRANDRCEYCLRQQAHSPLIPLHVEHIIPRRHGGLDTDDKLAPACADCNHRKSSDLDYFTRAVITGKSTSRGRNPESLV